MKRSNYQVTMTDVDTAIARAIARLRIPEVKTTVTQQSTRASTTHGELVGLGNDDHAQYYDTARGDARYSLTGHTHAQLHDRAHAITGTLDHTAGNWKLFHSNGSGQIAEVALGAAGALLTSGGASSAPAWITPSQFNASTAQQGAGFSSDTYLAGSSIAVPSGSLKQGSIYRCVFDVSSGGLGVAAPIIYVRFGTNGSTADTAIATLTFAAQTMVADDGAFEIFASFRAVGASAVVQVVGRITHALSITGLSTAVSGTVRATSGAFNSSTANSIIGLSVDAGALASWTVQLVQAELVNLA